MSDKLHSGISASEAVKKASEWWDKIGKDLIRKQANEEVHGRKFHAAVSGAPAIVTPGEKRALIQSGLLQGFVWERLTRRERAEVVKQWHEHVFVPGRAVHNEEGIDVIQRLKLDS
jgi:hypothetical protein